MATTQYVLPIIEGVNPAKLPSGDDFKEVIQATEPMDFWWVFGIAIVVGIILTFFIYETIVFIRNCNCFSKYVSEKGTMRTVGQRKVLRTLLLGFLVVFVALGYTLMVYLLA